MDQRLQGRRIAALVADGFGKGKPIAVRDGNLATSRGPQDLIPFVQGCLDLFVEHAPISRTGQQPVSRSAPQANEPPGKKPVDTSHGLAARARSPRHTMAGAAPAR